MNTALTVVSSKATQLVLADLVRAFEARTHGTVVLESVGGVDAAKRVRAGEPFDCVVLANDALEALLDAGQLLPGSKVAVARSSVAVAVRSGAPHPDIHSEQAVERAVLAARSLGRSTGPSGVALEKLFERWGRSEQLRDRIVVAPPGIPVGTLVARGEVELGFQQLSELLHVEGIDMLGPLPEPIQIVTTFSAAIGVHSSQRDRARALLAFLASPAAADAKRHQGMEPA